MGGATGVTGLEEPGTGGGAKPTGGVASWAAKLETARKVAKTAARDIGRKKLRETGVEHEFVLSELDLIHLKQGLDFCLQDGGKFF